MQSSAPHIFDKYKAATTEVVGSLSKTQAIKLSRHPELGLITPAKIGQLYASLESDGWTNKSAGANWVWRYQDPGDTESDEVKLERAIAKPYETRWGCQMSTASGVEGRYLHRRRAIDLVRYLAPRSYAFVELKTVSNNPLYAAFEILGYALAYLHARANYWKGSGNHNVFDAEQIELTILGPEKWYKFSEQGIEKAMDNGLAWLAKEITDSLNQFARAKVTGAPAFTLKFRTFPNDLDINSAARSIHQSAEDW